MIEDSRSQEPQVLTVEVGPDEPLVLPEVFKSVLGLEDGGIYTAVQFDGMVLLISRPLQSPQVLEQMRRALDEAGVTLEDLLDGLADIRSQMLRERYGITT